MKVAESMPVNVHGTVISVHIFLAKSISEQVILGRPWETDAPKSERNLDNGSCKITFSAVDGSEQVMVIATFPGKMMDRFASR